MPSADPTRRAAHNGADDRKTAAQSPGADISLTAGALDRTGLGDQDPALGQARVGSGVESVPQPGAALLGCFSLAVKPKRCPI
jgi:hypothetical protein